MLSPYLIHILILFCIYAILATGFQLSVGSGGLVNLAFVAFMAMGAYASAIATMHYHLPVALGIALALIIPSMTAGTLSLLLRKVRAEILVVITLAFHLALFTILQNWTDFTRGALGIAGIRRPIFFTEPESYLALSLILLGLVYLTLRAVVGSPFGRVLGALRDDETAAQILGKDTIRAKRIVYLITGAIAGLAGALFAHYIQFIDPKSFHLDQLVFLLSVIILGGLGSLPGTLIGTAVLLFVPEALRFVGLPPAFYGPFRQILWAAVVIVILLYRPRGILGKVMLR